MGLRFPPELVDGVRDGKITMQFGLWKRPRVIAGRVYVVKGLGIIRVTAVEKIDLTRLTPWEAEAAGAKDVSTLRSWLKAEDPTINLETGKGYRVRFRYLSPETGQGSDAVIDGEADQEVATEEGEVTPSPVVPKAVPTDLMSWVNERDWRGKHLATLASGIWRNADDISAETDVDSPTTRRRMGELRKRGLVSSHRHHGYRITPEGKGALAGMVDQRDEAAGSSAADWLSKREERSELLEVLKDGKWHNAADIGKVMNLSVVSIQRRVAALRDRGLVDSHRRRGYRMTAVGFEAFGLTADAGTPVEGGTAPTEVATAEEGPSVVGTEEEVAPIPHEEAPTAPLEGNNGVVSTPVPVELLEWLEARPHRRDLMMAIPREDYVSSGELAELLGTSSTTIHGRLKPMKEKGLVEALPRKGYTTTELGARVSEVIRVMASKRADEPEGASAFLSAEPVEWKRPSIPSLATTPAPTPSLASRIRHRWGGGDVCGFCSASTTTLPQVGWVEQMQRYLEAPTPNGKPGEAIDCRRGVFEDASWFLIVERNPLAEGHVKLVCKEHVWDLVELAEWSQRDQRLALARDTLVRDLMLAMETVMALDGRIVDVMVVSGIEQGTHLHFDLIPRWRMDLPGLRPLASSRAFYDDLSLVRKRRLWSMRREHLHEVAEHLREGARLAIAAHGYSGIRLTE